MSRIETVDLTDAFLEKVADVIERDYIRAGKDLRRLAVVFGGRRPQLFLQKELARRLHRGFLPPRFFTIDDFVARTLAAQESFGRLGDMDACYLIFRLAQRHVPDVCAARPTFAAFLPWAREILGFIEQLDLQHIRLGTLEDIQLHADIGYEVPDSINTLLKHIVVLRDSFHQAMADERLYSRGFIYQRCAEVVEAASFEEFDEIFFCNFFYLHRTERLVMKELVGRGRARLLFQGSADDWSVLEDAGRHFGADLTAPARRAPGFELTLHAGFDLHSQIAALRDVLVTIREPQNTVIVLPDPQAVMPLLAELAPVVEDFNVSMGYPVARSSLYSLFDGLFRAQASRKDGGYYVKDYLRLLGHPLTKNLELEAEPTATRVLIHKVEEVLLGMEPTDLAGSLFVRLDELMDEDRIFESAAVLLQGMGVSCGKSALKKNLAKLHEILLRTWEDIPHFRGFAEALERLLDLLLSKSPLEKYPLNLKIMERMYEIVAEFKEAAFKAEAFPQREIFKIFRHKLETDVVAFRGSPLKGLQVLGLLETRALHFDNVLVLDVNESVLPTIKIHEPLIPRDVMIGLGLDRFEKEEEIQRYQFTRLIASARRVALFYQENPDKHRSRFIEELIWEKEKAARRLGVLPVSRGHFRVKVSEEPSAIPKKQEHLAFLADFRFSASSLDTYLKCPLRFFYQYVLGLKEKEDVKDEPEATDIGTFIHGLLEETFKKFLGKQPVLDDRFTAWFMERLDEKFDRELRHKMKSDAFLVQEVLRVRLRAFLAQERERPVQTLKAVEKTYLGTWTPGSRTINVKARVDRIDELPDSSLLIIDYKTGVTDPLPQKGWPAYRGPLERLIIKNKVKSFQLPLYCDLVQEAEAPPQGLNAALVFLRSADKDKGFKLLFGSDADPQARQAALSSYRTACAAIIEEIFNPGISFAPDREVPSTCDACPFFYLCR